MTRVLVVALGLAAIDGLLCAFVAILAFSVVLMDSSENAPGDTTRGFLILTFEKFGAAPMATEFSIAVTSMPGGSEQRVVFAPDPSGGVTKERFPASPKAVVGAAAWHDCTSSDAICSSRLVLSSVKPNAQFKVQIRSATENLEQGAIQAISMQLRAIPNFKKQPAALSVPSDGPGVTFYLVLKNGIPEVVERLP